MFESIEDILVQSLVLVACLHNQDIIKEKESTQMKRFLLTQPENKAAEILKLFLRKKSLYYLRSVLRGQMGLPRTRSTDDSFSSAKNKKPKRINMSINLDGGIESKAHHSLPPLSPTKSHKSYTSMHLNNN